MPREIEEMAPSNAFHMLVALLTFSLLLSSNIAVPITRPGSLIHRPKAHYPIPVKAHEIKEGRNLEGELVSGRMTVQLNDYPGSGANNRHTPKAQSARVCTDC
ncbi:uncharacterized protein LOC115743980 [Rhodamnia argentea]|uniref:Uncharacterized protein LOC115743980 n=1 Tax=Rhodamnia argentea TaxID=178133 RepID=A0A8B8PKH7_9MYRT|nr:uncharacterized protein LOC115743980 [Rhodamnia argentea]